MNEHVSSCVVQGLRSLILGAWTVAQINRCLPLGDALQRARQRLNYGVAFGVLVCILVGCAGLSMEKDGPGRRIDTTHIPEAVPRAEPKSSSGNPPFYEVGGKRYMVLSSAQGYQARGVASWYGRKFHGRKTSSGERFDMYKFSAAHPTLPLPTYVQVTNLKNGKRLTVRVNDRGPFHGNRIIDLSYAAAVRLGFAKTGTAFVDVRAVGPGQSKALAPIITINTELEAFVQLGAFASRQNAQSLLRELKAASIVGGFVNYAQVASGENLYRVRLGPFASVDSLDSAVERLERAGIMRYRVVFD